MQHTVSEHISVVIPVYNRAELVLRTLRSFEEQTMLPASLILVDNNSTDNTLATLRQWQEAHRQLGIDIRVVSETTPGAAAARNRGLQEVSTEFVAFFDSDDTMRPEYIEAIDRAIHQNPASHIFLWRCRRNLPNGGYRLTRHTRSDFWSYQIYHSILSTQCYCVRTDTLRRCGAWNPAMLCWDDWELGIRLLLHAFAKPTDPPIVAIPDVLADVHPQRESITGECFHTKAGLWERAIDEAERQVTASTHPLRRKLLSRINYRRAILAADYRREGHPELAAPLLQRALTHPTLTPLRRLLLGLIYHYRALGGRGSALVWQ